MRYGCLPLSARESADTISRTRNIKKRTLAILAAAPAIPPKPRMPARIAKMRNASDHDNIMCLG